MISVYKKSDLFFESFFFLEIIMLRVICNPMNAIWNISIGDNMILLICIPNSLGRTSLGKSPPVMLPLGNPLGG